ncbi:MAG: hypothetical protein EP329_07610 [Deltaproteobacteria bacterium]|nr:MAG: hypothetical protein EP329_07610 [Deltaproteobacteria bacterium]
MHAYQLPSLLLGSVVMLSIAACPADTPAGPDASDTVETGDTTADADDADDTASPDTEVGDTLADTTSPDVPEDTVQVDTSGPWDWPWPAQTVDIPADASWKTTVAYPDDTFFAIPSNGPYFEPRWVKFQILTGDPSRVIFQDSRAYPLHFPFAEERVPLFYDLTPAQFDAVTLYDDSKQALLGAVLYAPLGGPREAAVQLAARDTLDPRVVDVVMDLVADALVSSDGGDAPQLFYFPSYEQAAAVAADAAWYAALGIRVDSAARWAGGDICYTRGWAVGRLVRVAGADIESAWASGALTPADLLLTDGVPAEVPHVAGIVSLTPSTPNSHVTILAETLGVPFVHVALAESAARAEALAGHLVALRAATDYGGGYGTCAVTLVDLDGRLDEATRAELLALKEPPALDYAEKTPTGALSANVDTLGPADIAHYGGKASNFGVLRDAIPDHSPSPAVAFSFDLWDGFLEQPITGGGTLRAAIDARLGGYAWPPDIAALKVDLQAIRDLFTDVADFDATQREAVLAALAGFDGARKIRFRSSTNMEDTESFVGAGLYDSYSGCMADDVDGDEVGPSVCDPAEAKERGVFRALRKVYASFYNDNAFLERLRHGIDEDTVGMAVLAHYSFPDEFELANGVATMSKGGSPTRHYELVTQKGAVSVTNPDGTAQPEVVTGDAYSFGTYFYLQQPSSLVPLGQHVLTWEDDYVALSGLFDAVAAAWTALRGGTTSYLLDFEYKKVAPNGDLVIKQVRPLPQPDRVESVTTYLLPTDAPTVLCTHMGESGTALGNHRGKVRLALTTDGTWLDAAGTAASYYAASSAEITRLDGPDTITLSGTPTGWPGAAHVVDGDEVSARWTDGAAEGLRTFTLTAQVDRLSAPSENPLRVLGDFSTRLEVQYATPQPDYGWEGWTTVDTDWVRLGACPAEAPQPGELLQHREGTVGGVTVSVDFAWPPTPTGDVAGYTAPLSRWVETRITGLTTEPIVLHGYWSQTYHPFHHNFTEEFAFEPAREPGLAQSILDELAAADVSIVYFRPDYGGVTLNLIGADGKVREVAVE